MTSTDLGSLEIVPLKLNLNRSIKLLLLVSILLGFQK